MLRGSRSLALGLALAGMAPAALAVPHDEHAAEHAAEHAGGHPTARAAAEVTRRALELVENREASPGYFPEQYLFEFADPAREAIDFFPLLMRERRPGLQLGKLPLERRRELHALLGALLSPEGALRVQAIRSLEDVLRQDQLMGFLRQSDAYTAQFFGRPSPESPWGFKFQGHHLSLNATVVDGALRGTPLFLGSNPAEVRQGPDAGLRVLAPQEDLARALLASLDEAQFELAWVGEFEGGLAIPSGGPLPPASEPAGLSASDMSTEQRATLRALVASYANNLRADVARHELARLDAAGLDALSFAWLGSPRPGEPCAYRVRGPTVAIQFDMINEGADANHIHCLWSDPEQDFGQDLLERHYAEQHGGEREGGHEHDEDR